MFLLTRLDKPVLLEGPAGVGKTELAKTLAAATGRRLLRLQCYEGQDESRALYQWDYGKPPYTQMLRDKIGELTADAPDLVSAVRRIEEQDSVFFSDRFLAPRPLLEAVRGEEPSVLLIDEVDTGPTRRWRPYSWSVWPSTRYRSPRSARTPRRSAVHRSDLQQLRDLSAALKRRCLHLSLGYPDAERELEILRSKETGRTVRLRGDHPQGAGDDLADPGTPVLLGPGHLRPASLCRVLRPRPDRRRPRRSRAYGSPDGHGGARTMTMDPRKRRGPSS
ncbi:hypothetical protein SANTM175S_00758 [Streptomyces antimycoticus]